MAYDPNDQEGVPPELEDYRYVANRPKQVGENERLKDLRKLKKENFVQFEKNHNALEAAFMESAKVQGKQESASPELVEEVLMELLGKWKKKGGENA